MAQWIWAAIVIVGIILIFAVALMVDRKRRSRALQRRFGPEYARTVESADDRRTAEAALADRARRRDRLEIKPLPEPVRLQYTEQWRRLQEQFVDRPVDAVAFAENLLTRVMAERGYPVGDFDEQTDLISVDHPHVVENYRVAHDIHRRMSSQDATTEDLREAMLRYRSLFDDLLHPDQNPGTPSDADATSDADGAARTRRRDIRQGQS